MSAFKLLYSKKCKVPINWNSLEEILVLKPDLLNEMEWIVQKTKKNLKTTQDWKFFNGDLKKS